MFFSFKFCSSDFVQVSDNSQSVNWKFCGKNSPFAVTVSQSPVTVHLYSDNGIEESGFRARYLLVKNKVNLGKKICSRIVRYRRDLCTFMFSRLFKFLIIPIMT